MNKITIPALLLGVIMIAGTFAFSPIEEASTVHTSGTVIAASVSAGGIQTPILWSAGSTTVSTDAFMGPTAFGSNVAEGNSIIASAGTIQTLYVSIETAPGGGQTWDVTLMKNGVDTTLTCQIAGAAATTCNDTTNSFTVVAGDLLTAKLDQSAGAVNTSGFRVGFIFANI